MADEPEDKDNAMITEYSATRTTFYVPGIIQTAVAGDDDDAEFIRVAAPVEREVIIWEAKREGGPPEVPSPVDPDYPIGYNVNMILLDFQIGIPVVMPIGAGSEGHIHIISGRAIYGKVKAEGLVRDYKSGTMPWEQTDPPKFNNYLPAENFVMDIIDPSLPSDSTSPTQGPELISGIPDPNRNP